MEILGRIALGYLMLTVSMIGPLLGTWFARYFNLDEFSWSLFWMPLALSVLVVGSGAVIVRVNRG